MVDVLLAPDQALLDHVMQNPGPLRQGFLVIEPLRERFERLVPALEATGERIYCFVDVPERRFFEHAMALTEDGTLLTGALGYRFHGTLASEYVHQALAALAHAVAHRLSVNGNDPGDMRWGLENLLANLDVISRTPGIVAYEGLCTGVPAVLVATGPSLDRSLPELAGIAEHAVTIACDASLKILLEAGIEPHFVTSIERVRAVRQFFLDLPWDVRTTLVALPVLDPAAWQAWGHRRAALVYQPVAQYQWLPPPAKGTLKFGHSSANLSLALAMHLGCDPIVFVGQDLAYEQGRSHAAGHVFGNEAPTNLVPVRGNREETVYTSPTWNLFRTGLEVALARWPGMAVNCTDGGARIAGVPWQPLAHVRRVYLSKVAGVGARLDGVDRRIAPKLARRWLQQVRTEHIPETLRGLRQLLKDLKAVRERGNEAEVLTLLNRLSLDVETPVGKIVVSTIQAPLVRLQVLYHQTPDAAARLALVLEEFQTLERLLKQTKRELEKATWQTK